MSKDDESQLIAVVQQFKESRSNGGDEAQSMINRRNLFLSNVMMDVDEDHVKLINGLEISFLQRVVVGYFLADEVFDLHDLCYATSRVFLPVDAREDRGEL